VIINEFEIEFSELDCGMRRRFSVALIGDFLVVLKIVLLLVAVVVGPVAVC
jgi:hypothetical protein